LLPKQLVILAGRPSMGKSAVASSYALGAASAAWRAVRQPRDEREELGERIAADMCFDSACQVPYSSITDKRVTGEQGRQIARAMDRLTQIPFGIIDTPRAPSASSTLVRRHSRRMAAQGQEARTGHRRLSPAGPPGSKTENRTHEITQVSMGSRPSPRSMAWRSWRWRSSAARSSSGPTSARSWPTSGRVGRSSRTPTAIMFLYRPNITFKQDEPAAHDPSIRNGKRDGRHRGKIEFIVAKRRRAAPEYQKAGSTAHSRRCDWQDHDLFA
jgi:replicative DNA helicase